MSNSAVRERGASSACSFVNLGQSLDVDITSIERIPMSAGVDNG